MLSHDVSFVSECVRPVTVLKPCDDSAERVKVTLTRRATSKEMQHDVLTQSQQGCMDFVATREWNKWNEVGVTMFLSQKQLNDIMNRNPDQKILGTKWVLTEKVIQGKQDYKAKLVVQGCQEDKGYIRTDAPTESSDAFFMTLAARAQDGWDCIVFDAQSAYLQSEGIERLLLLRMPHKKYASWNEAHASVLQRLVQITGHEMLGVLGASTVRKCSKPLDSWSQSLEQGLYYLHGPDGPEAFAHTHVNDFLIAFTKAYRDALKHLVHTLHPKQQTGTVVARWSDHFQGWQPHKSDTKVTHAKSTLGLERMSIDLAGRTLESALTSAEITGHRSVLGQLLWLGQQSRPDRCVGVPLAAQRLSKATLPDVKALNKLVDQARSTAEMGIVLPSGVVNLKTCSVVCYADAARHPELVKTGHFDLSTITSWQSTTTKRVVRSILAAAGHAVSEGLEPPQWFTHLLTEAQHGSQLSDGR